jgi:hypothetical protein
MRVKWAFRGLRTGGGFYGVVFTMDGFDVVRQSMF